jgi:hypothetical protein
LSFVTGDADAGNGSGQSLDGNVTSRFFLFGLCRRTQADGRKNHEASVRFLKARRIEVLHFSEFMLPASHVFR